MLVCLITMQVDMTESLTLKPITVGPITVGNVTIDRPVILAPMSGVTDLPFRRLVKRHGAGLVVSEMIASEAMIRQTRQSMTMAKSCVEEQPMAVQSLLQTRVSSSPS